MDNRFLFLGGDKRIMYALHLLSQQFVCDRMGQGGVYPEPIGKYGRIVLPLPATRDGVNINAPLSDAPLPLSLVEKYADKGAVVFSGGSNPAVRELCDRLGLTVSDYFADEPLTLKNAALTAEAAAAILAQSTDGSIFGSAALITGYGRCASLTARLLNAAGAKVTVCARNPAQRTHAQLDGMTALPLDKLTEAAQGADFIINTVPARIFTEEDFTNLHENAVFMELATLPPEPVKALCEKNGVQYIHAAGLPGKCSPKTAGELIADAILDFLEKT